MRANNFALMPAILLLLSACAEPPPLWNKTGATEQQFNTDKYQCMQGSQQQTSSAYIGPYGGSASSGQSTNTALFNACMNAKGWRLERQSASNQSPQITEEAKAAAEARRRRYEQICADPRFQPYFAKTACGADKITFAQLADTTKASPEVRAIFIDVRNAIDSEVDDWLSAERKYGGAIGAKKANLYLATAKIENDRNNLNLYNGQITWGEYNTRRQEIYKAYAAASR